MAHSVKGLPLNIVAVESVSGSSPIPWRYFFLVWAMAGMMITTGTRSCFALVMTHISNLNTSKSGDNLFPNCTTIGEEAFELPYAVDIIAYFHTIYYVGALIAQLPGGFMAARFSPKRVCGFGLFINSALFALLPLAIRYHASAVMSIRLLQGIVELGSGPAMYVMVSAWAPVYQKTMFISFIYAGQYLSPALAMFISGATTCYLTWNSIFFIVGGFGALWSVIFLCAFTDNPHDCRFLGLEERNLYGVDKGVKMNSKHLVNDVPWKAIVTSMPVQAIFVAEFAKCWVFALMGTQIQEYFKDVFRLNTATVGTLSAAPELCMFMFAASSGFLFDFLQHHRFITMTQGRKLFQCVGAGVEAVCLFSLFFLEGHQWKAAFALLCVGVGVSGLGVAGYETNVIDLAPQYTGFIAAFMRYGLAGSAFSTWMIGAITGDNGSVVSWQTVFMTCGLLHLSGVIFYGVFASGEVQQWARSTIEHDKICTNEKEHVYGSTSAQPFT